MSTIQTTLGAERESARLIRFETAAGINQTNVQKAIEQLATSPPAINPTPVTVANSPFAVNSNHSLLEVDTSGGPVTITLQPGAVRNGRTLAIKDITGNGATNNITLQPNGGETVDQLAPFLIRTDFGGVVLNPRAGGYSVAP